MDQFDQRACRLCFETHAHLINIYDDDFEPDIANIISEHVSKVTTTNYLQIKFLFVI